MSHKERILLDCLSGTIDSLEYIEKTHPGLSGFGVRQSRIKAAKELIEEIITSTIIVTTPAELMLAMTSAASAPLVQIDAQITVTGYLSSVERESGGGKCFNVKMRVGGSMNTYFIRFS